MWIVDGDIVVHESQLQGSEKMLKEVGMNSSECTAGSTQLSFAKSHQFKATEEFHQSWNWITIQSAVKGRGNLRDHDL